MSSTFVKAEGLFSGRRLYIQLWYVMISVHQCKQSSRQNSVTLHVKKKILT